MTATLVIKKGRAKPLWHGHPWVYAQAVQRVEGSYDAGDVVDVRDSDGRFIGRGHGHPRSSLVARLLTRDEGEAVDLALVRRRLVAAIGLRRALGLPSDRTDAFRLVNSEGDGLSGLVVDRYGDLVAVQFNSLGFYRLAEGVFALLAELLAPRLLVEVVAGRLAREEGVAATARVVRGPATAAETEQGCREHGLRLFFDPLRGQKTGLYLDQRDNRRGVRRLASGREVLDLYSYSGGFALNAARGGARRVVAVDASARALGWLARGAEENELSVETVEQDAFRFLAGQAEQSFDLVVVDPPKFARSRREQAAALKGYRKLHGSALRLLRPGGLLCAACCSQLLATADWLRTISAAGAETGRAVRLLELSGAGADHPRPVGFAEGDYLRFALCLVAD
jgi:23S rRNA (cytosine1962-C5)-methyltransferase